MGNRRLNIGLAVGNIDDQFSNQLTRGAADAAEVLDVNLIIIPGKYIDLNFGENPDAKYEYQYNVMFSYANSSNLDYIAVALGSIAFASRPERQRMFMHSFGIMPTMTIASKLDGFDYVKYDNETSIIEIVNYLVHNQHKKKIAMFTGFDSNEDANERLEAYKKALALNDIAFDEKRVEYGDLTIYSRKSAERLIDNNPDIEAVLCCNDQMAMVIYEVLKERNIEIGTDVMVVGFDDIPAAAKMDPPLATVSASAYKLGYLAISNAVDILNGKKPASNIVETTFVRRQSCGLTKLCELNGGFNSEEIVVLVENVVASIMGDSNNKIRSEMIYKATKDMFINLTDALLFGKGDVDVACNHVLELLGKLLRDDRDYFMSLEKIYESIENVIIWFNDRIGSVENRQRFNDLYDEIYKKFAYDVVVNVANVMDSTVEMNHRTNLVMRDMLMFDNSLNDSYSSILKKMCYLDINSSYVYVFPKPIIHHASEGCLINVKEWDIMAYQYGNRTYSVPAGKQKLKTSQLFSHEFLPDNRRYTMIMNCLYSNEYQYGMLLCELKPEYFQYHEFFTYQLSAAVKIIGLLEQQQKNLLELHANNLELDNISKLDELTGLLNRRGFYSAAKNAVSIAENRGKYAVIAFCDVDNLKLINDRYGHVEGDCALKSIGTVLRKIFRSSDIVGRVGGDEFVALAIVREKDFGDKIRARRGNILDRLNENSGKPYMVGMSMGIYEYECGSNEELSDAIDKADDLLYMEKRKRRKNIDR